MASVAAPPLGALTEDDPLQQPEIGQWPLAWRRLRRHRLGMVGLTLLVLILGVSYAAPIIAPFAPNEIDLFDTFGRSSSAHTLGTDELGRDILSRLFYAGRVTLSVALGATLLVNLVGVPLGALAAYQRGWVEAVIMRLTDVMLALPTLLMLLVVSGML